MAFYITQNEHGLMSSGECTMAQGLPRAGMLCWSRKGRSVRLADATGSPGVRLGSLLGAVLCFIFFLIPLSSTLSFCLPFLFHPKLLGCHSQPMQPFSNSRLFFELDTQAPISSPSHSIVGSGLLQLRGARCS